jgi:hypothetical protein
VWKSEQGKQVFSPTGQYGPGNEDYARVNRVWSGHVKRIRQDCADRAANPCRPLLATCRTAAHGAFKNTRFRQSLLVTAAIVAAPALAATVILATGKAATSTAASQPGAAVTLSASSSAAATTAVVAAATAPATTAAGSPLMLGAQTHFSQGWPAGVNDLAAQAQAPLLRDLCPGRRARRARANMRSMARRRRT